MTQRLLEGKYEEPSPTHDTEWRLDNLESRLIEVEHAANTLRRDAVLALLNLLSQAIREVVSGKIDLGAIETPAANDKWEPIKKRLPPRQSEAVDILLAQGAMKRTQLAAAMKMNYTNCATNVIAVLIRQGIVIERGGQIELKQL